MFSEGGEVDGPQMCWKASRKELLWALVVTSATTDIVTTAIGLQLGLAEGNPVVESVLVTYGWGAFIGMKLVTIGIAAVATAQLAEQVRPLAPAALFLPWFLVSIINTVQIVAIIM